MTRTTRTNPEYAAMAYRKAILGQCLSHLVQFTPAMGEAPSGKIVSEDLIREESEVPQEEIQEFILVLQQEAESLRLEMRKFDFVKREKDVQQPEPQNQARDDASKPTSSKGKRRRKQARSS